MGDLFRSKLRLSSARAKLFRRASTQSSLPTSTQTSPKNDQTRNASSTPKLIDSPTSPDIDLPKADVAARKGREDSLDDDDQPPSPTAVDRQMTESLDSGHLQTLQNSVIFLPSPSDRAFAPKLTLEAPSPDQFPDSAKRNTLVVESPSDRDEHTPLPTSFKSASSQSKVDPSPLRKQSLVDSSNAHVIQALLQAETHGARKVEQPQQPDYFQSAPPTFNSGMLHRKIWVKRPSASATLVQVREDDLVDDVRDMILKKYGNSLGRSFDAPDIALRIISRAEQGHKHVDRTLGPEEPMCQTLDQAYPGGQSVEEALIIDVPQRRTPRPSPRGTHPYMHGYLDSETARPVENGTDYFPPMPPPAASPAITTVSHHSAHGSNEHARAMSVLNTGQVPPLPSPGGTRRTHPNRSNRPSYIRQHTSSPTSLTNPDSAAGQKQPRPRLDSSASDHRHGPSRITTSGLPTPPAQNHDGTPVAPNSGLVNSSHPNTPRVSSPGPRKKRQKKPPAEAAPPGIPTSLGLDTSVPPINVLIVEDNHINLKLLEQFIRRLKVRWGTAVNGREAVNKWRTGGFHLVLMDIQLPIMSGLEATREIRRLESVNGIGVFSGSSASSEAPKLRSRMSQSYTEGVDLNVVGQEKGETKEEDRLDVDRFFKSPVIIVALTASNLQVDRHEALAAGCNDFLTKPVNFVWFERKVKEWGCMQALIDFDGWRKWKDFASAASDTKAANGTKDKKPLKDVKKPALPKQALPQEDGADSATPDAESSSN